MTTTLKGSLISGLNEIEGWYEGITIDVEDCAILKNLHKNVCSLLTYCRELKDHIREQAEDSMELLEEGYHDYDGDFDNEDCDEEIPYVPEPSVVTTAELQSLIRGLMRDTIMPEDTKSPIAEAMAHRLSLQFPNGLKWG